MSFLQKKSKLCILKDAHSGVEQSIYDETETKRVDAHFLSIYLRPTCASKMTATNLQAENCTYSNFTCSSTS